MLSVIWDSLSYHGLAWDSSSSLSLGQQVSFAASVLLRLPPPGGEAHLRRTFWTPVPRVPSGQDSHLPHLPTQRGLSPLWSYQLAFQSPLQAAERGGDSGSKAPRPCQFQRTKKETTLRRKVTVPVWGTQISVPPSFFFPTTKVFLGSSLLK